VVGLFNHDEKENTHIGASFVLGFLGTNMILLA
jgi:hypothetical protein